MCMCVQPLVFYNSLLMLPMLLMASLDLLITLHLYDCFCSRPFLQEEACFFHDSLLRADGHISWSQMLPPANPAWNIKQDARDHFFTSTRQVLLLFTRFETPWPCHHCVIHDGCSVLHSFYTVLFVCMSTGTDGFCSPFHCFLFRDISLLLLLLTSCM